MDRSRSASLKEREREREKPLAETDVGSAGTQPTRDTRAPGVEHLPSTRITLVVGIFTSCFPGPMPQKIHRRRASIRQRSNHAANAGR
jgi:hypothetical protein